MNEQLEHRLRRDLSSIDAAPLDDVGRIERATLSATERARRRRRARVLGASGALVMTGGLAIWNLGDNSAQVSTLDSVVSVTVSTPTSSPTYVVAPGSSPPSTLPGSSIGWQPIAADPRGAVLYPSVVWAEGVAIVFGGRDEAGKAVDGAAQYSPVFDTWKRLAEPPAEMSAAPRTHTLSVWTGEEVLAVGGESRGGATVYADGAAFDPAADAWRVIAAPPRPISARSPWVWTGSELLVWPPDEAGSAAAAAPLAYTPAADTWRELPLPPVASRQRAASVWTGDEWLVWGGSADGAEFADGAAYIPASDSWRVISSSPLSARRVNAAWTGTEMIVAAGSSGGDPITGNGELAHGDGAAYDPRTDTWRTIAAGPAHPGFEPVWTGEQLLMFAKGGAVTYDPVTDRWQEDCCGSSPTTTPGAPVWTGSQVLLVGSTDPLIGGATYVPPATSAPVTAPPPQTATSTELAHASPDALASALADRLVQIAR